MPFTPNSRALRDLPCGSKAGYKCFLQKNLMTGGFDITWQEDDPGTFCHGTWLRIWGDPYKTGWFEKLEEKKHDHDLMPVYIEGEKECQVCKLNPKPFLGAREWIEKHQGCEKCSQPIEDIPMHDHSEATKIIDFLEAAGIKAPMEKKTLIDCDTQPFIPKGWQIESHQKGGMLEFDPAKVLLHIDDGQKDGRTIVGNELRKRLEGKPVINANVLDFLLANTNLIPDWWKTDEQGRTRYIYFWGTVYRRSNGNSYVRFLCFRDGRWLWDYIYLDFKFDGQHPAAVSAIK